MISIVGAGRVGTAIGIRLHEAGYPIGGVMCRSLAAAEAAVRLIGDGTPATEIDACLSDAQIIFVTVPDRVVGEIASVIAARLAPVGRIGPKLTLVHTSGSLPSAILSSASSDRISVVSMHPVQTLADPVQGAKRLIGTVWGIEGDPAALPLAKSLVQAMQGTPVVIDPSKKPLYHAAASVSSNFLITLLDIGLKMMDEAGVARDDALKALTTLMTGAIQNARAVGVPDALTGPIERGDVSTVMTHLDLIGQTAQKDPTGRWDQIQDIYRLLAKHTVDVARQKHGLNPDVGAADQTDDEHVASPVSLKDRLDQILDGLNSE